MVEWTCTYCGEKVYSESEDLYSALVRCQSKRCGKWFNNKYYLDRKKGRK